MDGAVTEALQEPLRGRLQAKGMNEAQLTHAQKPKICDAKTKRAAFFAWSSKDLRCVNGVSPGSARFQSRKVFNMHIQVMDCIGILDSTTLKIFERDEATYDLEDCCHEAPGTYVIDWWLWCIVYQYCSM